jgi:hypothetical protein
MKSISEMSQPEIGAFVVAHLKKMGIPVVLSGGAVVSIYTRARYISKDLDLVNIYSHRTGEIKKAMAEIGFREEGRYFKNPDSEFFIEFPPGPLSVGTEPIREIQNKRYETGILTLISPTECVKDRLAAYYHWADLQSLEQAILVTQNQKIDLEEVKRWSKKEGKLQDFKHILTRLSSKKAKLIFHT